MNKTEEKLKFRSTINPLALIINIILYGVLVYLVISKNPEDNKWLMPVMLVLVVIIIFFDVLKYIKYKYYFDNKALIIIHRRNKYVLPYKDIKYYEVDSHETRGIIYGYGVRRILIAVGKAIDEIYLVTPAKEKEFVELLEKKLTIVRNNKR